VDFAGKFTYKLANAREGKSFGGRIEDGQESKSKEKGSTRETDGEVSAERPERRSAVEIRTHRIADLSETTKGLPAERPQPFFYFQ
jgi:hypothetical protein